MDNNQLAYQELIKGIQQYIDDVIKNANFDKTYTAVIMGAGYDGYTVLLNGIQYSDIPTLGGTCHINETVQVVAPQNNMNNMYILKFDTQSSGDGDSN